MMSGYLIQPFRSLALCILIVLGASTQHLAAQILAWDFNGHSGDSASVFANTRNANLQNSQITRGSGVNADALGNSFNSTAFSPSNNSLVQAVTDQEYLQFTLQPSSGYYASLTTLDVNFRRSATGPQTFQWQYSTDGTNFTNIGSSITFTSTADDGVAQTQILLSSIPALQNVSSSTIITFRLYAWNATNTNGTFALGRLTGNDLAIGGNVFSASALAFDGTDDRISTTGTMLATPPTQFTIEWWLYPFSRTDFNQGLGIGNNWGDFAFHTTATGSVYVGTDMTNRMTPSDIPANTVVLNTWQHFTFVFNNGEGRFYKDGVLIARKTGMATPQNFNTFYMGVFSTSSFIHGYLDEVRVWSTARSCEELKQYRNCELTGNEANLLCYFQFNQGIASGANTSVTTLLNRVTGGLTGTLTGFNLTNGNSTSNWVSQSAVTLGNTCPATITFPEINLQGNSTNIVSGTTTTSATNHTDFGGITGTSLARTFTIQNTGTANLTVSGISVGGTNASEFVVSGITFPATITNGTSTTFTVTFTPTANGTRTATISVANNDCDEPSYTFAVSGGRQASALAFNGSNNRVVLPNQLLANLNQFTFESWVYVNTASIHSVYAEGLTNSLNPMFSLSVVTNGGIEIVLRNSSSVGLTTTTAAGMIPTGVWKHIAFVRTSATSAQLYIDGLLSNSFTFTDPGTITVDATNIGVRQRSFFDGWLNGSVDDMRIWNTVRTCDQISQLRNCELAGNETGLVAYYNFNQNVADGTNTGLTTLTNAVSGGSNGTLTNFTLSGTTSNWTAPGGVTTGTSCPASITAPEINLQGNSTNIVSGTTTTSVTNHTDFGVITGTSFARTYTIFNTGNADLTVSGITVSGTNASEYVVSGVPTSIAQGSYATFTVTLTPTGLGVRNATITVNNNDCDEGTYTFAVKGRATTPAALSFDGANDYVSSPNTQSIMGATPTTIEFWAKGALQGIGFPLCINTADVAVRFHSTNRVQLERFGGPSYDMGVVNDACWHHYAFAWDGTTVYGYVDGQPAPNPSATVSFPATSATGTFYVGVYNLQYFYTGLLDEVRVWNTFRSQSQIQSTMYSELAGNETNLIRYYNFNDGTPNASNASNTTLYDNSTAGNNGTLNSFTLSGTSSNWVTSGALIQYPEINVQGGSPSANVVSGTSTTSTTNGTDFGALTTTNLVRTYTIQNTGAASLTVTTITATGGNAGDFQVGGISLPATITAGSSTTFTVTFTPTANGTRTTTINIANNDCDEALYTFAVSGGRQAAAISFSGSSNYIERASRWNVGTNDFSIEAWVYPTTTTGYRVIVGQDIIGNTSHMFRLGLLDNNAVEFYFCGSSSSNCGGVISSNNAVAINTWSHIAVTRSGTETRLYVNGALVSSFTAASVIDNQSGADAAKRFRIGSRSTSSNTVSDPFVGRIDEVRLWTVARTCDQIAAYRSCELAGNESGLLSYYKFNQNIADGTNSGATTLTDATSNAVNGTLTGFTLSGTTSNWTSPGGVTTGTSCPTSITAPEINLQGNSNDIVSGATTTSATNHTDFGGITATSLARTYTIQNTGTSDLTLSGITVGGTNATEFAVSGISFPATITQGTSTTFTVTFTPTANGTRTATISVANNDCDEAPYTFAVSGGRQGSGLAFDGSNDYVDIGTPITTSSSYTKEAWIYLTAGGSNKNIISSQSNPFWVNNRVLYAGNNGIYNVVGDATQLPLNTWIHVAVTYDAPSNTMRLYKDGVLVSQNVSSPVHVPEPITIGAHYSAVSVFQGRIDEVRVWNVARTCDQISQLRNCELVGNEAGLVSYFKMNQGVAGGHNTSVTSLSNSVSGGVNGTLNNFARTNGDTLSNFITPGGVTTGTSCGTVSSPEINLQGNSTNIVSGTTTTSATNHTDFGGITGTSLARTFTIQNTGNADLTVSGITVGGTNASEYVVSGITFPATITNGSSTTFIVTFTPTANGTRTATISIANNDCDEAPYTFAVSGGRQGAALAFDGSNDVIAFTNTSDLSFERTDPRTFELWFKTTSTSTASLISKFLTGSPTTGFEVRLANGNPALWLNNNYNGSFVNSLYVSSNSSFNDGQWHHLAITYDGSSTANGVKIYVDGVERSKSVSADNLSASIVNNIQASIGGRVLTGDAQYNGEMDEIRIWNTVRTCDQISQLRNCELAGNEAGLIAYYKFNQGVADGTNTGLTTLTNSVSGGANGTLTNFALSGTTSNWTSPGGVTTGTSCGTVTAPEINLQGNSNDIVSGTTTTSATNHTDFGGITGTSLARTFTIQNTGTSDLTVSGISVGGTNATEFVVSGITFPATITQGTSTTFIVTFTPTANGTRTATISIANNDCDEAPYTFTVSGGRQGAALALGGTNDYVALTGTNTTLDGVANFTIEHWVKWDGIGGVGLVGKGANGCCTNTIHTGFANSGMFFLKVGNQDGAITDAGVVPTNTWVHLAAVYDGTQSVASNRIKLYKDGVLQNSSMFGSIPAVAPSPNVPFVIGAALSDGTYNYNGQIDEARIWNTARTCDQISQLRNCELAGNETGLVAYYKFNQGVADGSNTGLTTLTNSVSGGSNGTLTNFTLSGTTSNWTSPGGVTTGTSCGTVTAPEINLQGNSSDIVKGATTTSTANHTDFGSNASRTFTIQNTGNTALTVSNIILSGTNASEYSIAGITLPATVNATSSTTFVVNFVSGGSGFRTATVSVNTNDCDEAAYDFAIRALGTPATFTIGFDKRVLHADQRMKPINLSVSIVNGSNPSWQLKSITSTEADAGVAENDQPNDIQNATLNTADTQFDLRAERIGRGGNGRVYLVTLQLTDNGVNRDTVFAIVVPVNLGLSRMDATGSTIANVVVAQTSPNPNTAGNVTLTMTSPQANANRVQVRVFNSRGKDIQWLYNAALASGTTSLSWNVTDRQGATVPNGVYYIQVLGDGVISTPLPVRINR